MTDKYLLGWHIHAITPIPPGIEVTFDDDGDQFNWPAIALIHRQAFDSLGRLRGEDICLGVLNPYRGEVEVVDADTNKPFPIAQIPRSTPAVPSR